MLTSAGEDTHGHEVAQLALGLQGDVGNPAVERRVRSWEAEARGRARRELRRRPRAPQTPRWGVTECGLGWWKQGDFGVVPLSGVLVQLTLAHRDQGCQMSGHI